MEDREGMILRENERLINENSILLARIEMLGNEKFFLREVVKNFSYRKVKEE